METISKENPEFLRNAYTPGTRIRLEYMDDVQAPPIGTSGTVKGVDDIGNIMVNWDNGSSLSVIYEIDRCTIVKEDENENS